MKSNFNHSSFKYALIDQNEKIIDTCRAINAEEAKEHFILFHGFHFVSDKLIICIPFIYTHQGRMIHLNSYFE